MSKSLRGKRKAAGESSSDEEDVQRPTRSKPTDQSSQKEPVAGPSRRRIPVRGEERLTRNQIAREVNSESTSASSSRQSQSSQRSGQSSGNPSSSGAHRNRLMTPELSDQEEGAAENEEDDADETESLSKYLLAGIMRNNKMTEPQLQRLLQRCCKELQIENVAMYTSEQGVSMLIKKIKSNLQSINLNVKKLNSELDGRALYYFGPIKGNEALKFQNNWNKHDAEMFQRWVKCILGSDLFRSTSRELYLETKSMKGKRDADGIKKLIGKLTEMGYLEKALDDEDDSDDDEDPPLTLGIRSIDEFMNDINKLFPNALVACRMCQGTLLHGYECSALDCKNSLHYTCWEKYKQVFPDHLACPRNSDCSRNWGLFPPEKRRRFVNEQEPNSDDDEQETQNDDQQRMSDIDSSD